LLGEGIARGVKAFKSPERTLGGLDAASAAALIAAAADIAIVTDKAGVIRDVAIQNEELAAELEGHADWTGKAWVDVVTAESRPKIEALLRQTEQSGVAPRWRHVNYPSASGRDVPALVSAIRLSGDGRVVGFGRDLRSVSELQYRLVDAQQAMERDHARRQQMERRYRILFQTTPDAVLIVDLATSRIAEANAAAEQMVGGTARRLTGRPFTELFDAGSGERVQAALAGLRSAGRADEVTVRLAEGGRDAVLSAYLFRQDAGTFALVRLAPTGAKWPRLDAVVLTTASGEVVTANPAFLALVQAPSEEQVRGESLDRWLGRAGVDLNVLLASLRQRGSVRMFGTTFRDEYGAASDVEISAASLAEADQTYFGFVIRGVAQRLPAPAAPAADAGSGRVLPRSVEQLTELIGRVTLKDLVREATDMVERLCIEAALEMTNDNRAAAAEILGLSRQSLYVKLRRYGLGDLSDSAS
jgi:transcriptional regulator PpsR